MIAVCKSLSELKVKGNFSKAYECVKFENFCEMSKDDSIFLFLRLDSSNFWLLK